MRTRRTLRGHLAKIYAMHWGTDSRCVGGTAGMWAFMVGGWGRSSQAGIGKEKTGHCCQTCSRQDSWPRCCSPVTTLPSTLSSQLHGTAPVPPWVGGVPVLCVTGGLTCPLCAILRGDLPTVPWLFFPACSRGLVTTSSPGFGDLVQGSEASPCGVRRVKTVTCVS